MEQFLKKFELKPEGAGLVGVEREFFLADVHGKIRPLAPVILGVLTNRKEFGYELSACQLEARVGPCELKNLKKFLIASEKVMQKTEKKLGIKRIFYEVGPEDMPLDIYPDPTGRYQQIIKNMPREVLSAACRVIGTHIHIGMPDHKTALLVYNQAIKKFDYLCRIGDKSDGLRHKIYKIVAQDYRPPAYKDWEEFYLTAEINKFAANPRNCWHMIRISIHGTIEFRMFGSTENINEIIQWAEECKKICQKD